MIKKNGFTLIELLVVVAIIGILAAVGVVAYSGYTSSAKANATKSNHKLFVKYANSLLMKCHSGETDIFLKVSNTGLPQNYSCNTAMQNFLNLYATHLWNYKKINNPYRTDQPAFRATTPQNSTKADLGYTNMWIVGSSPYAPIKVYTMYRDGDVLETTITICLAGGCNYSR